jgi:hypothetical protein
VRHSRNTNEFLEVPGNELRSVVGDDKRVRLGVFLFGLKQWPGSAKDWLAKKDRLAPSFFVIADEFVLMDVCQRRSKTTAVWPASWSAV